MTLTKVKKIILEGSDEEKRALFSFDNNDPIERVVKKFELFARSNYPRYFKYKSAPFHKEFSRNFIKSYRGENVLIKGFRGCAKTAKLKLFIVFVLLNDRDASRKFIKILTKDGNNSKQIVTDVYNMILEVQDLYGDQFEQEGKRKTEQTMSSFTMRSGVKLLSGTVGKTQRGHVQDAYRPDWIYFDDIEDSESVSSQVITQGIILKIEEALNGRSKDGSYICTANYISEEGAVQHLINRTETIQTVPLFDAEGNLTWDIYSEDEINEFKKSIDYFGEYMCDPSRSENKFFDIDRIERDMKACRAPQSVSAGFKYWGTYQPHHYYGIGADTSEGIGKDANAASLFDFYTGELIGTYANNMIAPDLFGYELKRVGNEFGNCIIAPERNNTGHATITALKDYTNVYTEVNTENRTDKKTNKLGWNTNRKTRPLMLFDFRKDYNDGLIKIYDIDLLKEMKSFTNNDIDEKTTGLITRHFDLLISACIGWQMKKYAIRERDYSELFEEPEEDIYSDIFS